MAAAATRQPQMLNSFLRAVKSCRPTTHRSIRHPPSSRSTIHTTRHNAQSTYPNRYGPAATESLPPPPKPAGSLSTKKEDVKSTETQSVRSKQSSQPQPPQGQAPSEKQENQTQEQHASKAQQSDKQDRSDLPGEESPLEQATSAVQAKQQSGQGPPGSVDVDPNEPLGHKELDMVLSVPVPSEVQQGQGSKVRHPHLEPSPYEHHFDTYSLVQELAKDHNTFSEKQAITIMKAIRLMLTLNLDIAKEGLVSKSDVENESYLFRAACSELNTTLQTTRASENQRQRTQRASLQHEMDILNQKVTQDMHAMREDLKGMFNDRKMSLQEEKRKIDSQISELNYEITVLLNSEAKSEVEGLRWVLTRRAALAIGGAAFMVLSALQYYSVKSREHAEIEKKRVAANKAQEERIANETQARYTTPSQDSGSQTDMKGYEESLG